MPKPLIVKGKNPFQIIKTMLHFHVVFRLHIMSGKSLPGIIDTAMGDVYKENIMYAAGSLEKHGIVGLIEPISQHVVPNYYMNSFPLGDSDPYPTLLIHSDSFFSDSSSVGERCWK